MDFSVFKDRFVASGCESVTFDEVFANNRKFKAEHPERSLP